MESLSSQNRYIMGNAIFLVKGDSSINIPVKVLEAVEVCGKLPFFKYLSIIVFFGKS